MNWTELLERTAKKDPTAFGELLSLIELEPRGAVGLLDGVCRADTTRRTDSVGFVGAAGAGKSTLIGGLLRQLSDRGESVAVVAIDPSSPFTGGAVLGDRIRMQACANLPGVFVRSMGTRGQGGGLSASMPAIVEVLCGLGFDALVVESAGAGQVDIAIADVADTVVVVVVPGWGDAIQVAKAGLLEIADIFVVNKCDQPDALEAVRDLEMMLSYSRRAGWTPPVLRTSAASGEGIEVLHAEILRHREHLSTTGEGMRRRTLRLAAIIKWLAVEEVASVWDDARVLTFAREVASNGMSVTEAVAHLVGNQT